jgi:uncharacterized membrane protein
MLLLIFGMVIFLAVHLIPTFVAFRQKLIAWKGEAYYRIGYSCAALIGLILIIIGKGRAEYTPIWDPPGWSYHFTRIAMLAALILFPAAYMPTNLNRMNWVIKKIYFATISNFPDLKTEKICEALSN